MNTEPIKEVLNELFSHLERLETQSDAILQFLKEKKRVTDKQLAPYLEQAGNASNVRWRAARVRIEHLLSSMEDKEEEIKLGKKPEMVEETTNKKQAMPEENKQPEQADKSAAASTDKQAEAETSQQPSPKQAPSPKADAPTQGKGEQSGERKEESSHPTEMTEEMAQREGAEPPPELSSEKNSNETKSGEKEAA